MTEQNGIEIDWVRTRGKIECEEGKKDWAIRAASMLHLRNNSTLQGPTGECMCVVFFFFLPLFPEPSVPLLPHNEVIAVTFILLMASDAGPLFRCC